MPCTHRALLSSQLSPIQSIHSSPLNSLWNRNLILLRTLAPALFFYMRMCAGTPRPINWQEELSIGRIACWKICTTRPRYACECHVPIPLSKYYPQIEPLASQATLSKKRVTVRTCRAVTSRLFARCVKKELFAQIFTFNPQVCPDHETCGSVACAESQRRRCCCYSQDCVRSAQRSAGAIV